MSTIVKVGIENADIKVGIQNVDFGVSILNANTSPTNPNRRDETPLSLPPFSRNPLSSSLTHPAAIGVIASASVPSVANASNRSLAQRQQPLPRQRQQPLLRQRQQPASSASSLTPPHPEDLLPHIPHPTPSPPPPTHPDIIEVHVQGHNPLITIKMDQFAGPVDTSVLYTQSSHRSQLVHAGQETDVLKCWEHHRGLGVWAVDPRIVEYVHRSGLFHLTQVQWNRGVGNGIADSRAGIGNADFRVGIGNADFEVGNANVGSLPLWGFHREPRSVKTQGATS
ncbi:hypothetical protein Taro_007273 [Colocasia esculenta]|uniref:Uncharacterized protein n=1 Tax=Colocasia esculenta TaxID=4460 RepID=A0A843U001_COLES|nr:hypothetical protein [Colocasia esculenta]